MDIMERTRYAMEHYMQANPEIVSPLGRRGYFDMQLVPEPTLGVNQWSDGDMTSRALDAWMFARLITGDRETGRAMEDEQFRYFRNLFHRDSGLVFVPEHSEPNRRGYYTHLWDQGRALRHLSNMLLHSYRTEEMDVRAAIDRMLETLIGMSATETLEDGETARYWVTDTYVDGQPIDRTLDYGETNFIDFTVACAQFLEPVVNVYKATGEGRYLALATELANGFIGGYERRRGSTKPMFAPDGAFRGHFHTCVSGLTGICELAKQLYAAGDREKAEQLVKLAERSYEWIFAGGNPVRGSSSGWFPEGAGEAAPYDSELCCTADMIEFAASLAGVSTAIPGHEDLDRLWEDVERFTVNELCAMQIIRPETFRMYRINPPEGRDDMFEKTARVIDGGWAASRNWLSEMFRLKDGAQRQIYTIGCCLYSGQRGFYRYLNAMAEDDRGTLIIRYGGSYETPLFRMSERPEGGFEMRLSRDREVRVRVPGYAAPGSFSVSADGGDIPFSVRSSYAAFHAGANLTYKIGWNNKDWTSRETVGAVNNGYITDAPTGRQLEYALTYRGRRLTGITPRGGTAIPPTIGFRRSENGE